MRSIICIFGMALACGAAVSASAQTGTPRNVAIRQSYLKAMCRVATEAEVKYWESQNVTPASSRDEAPYISAHRNYMRGNPAVKASVALYSYRYASFGRYNPKAAEIEHWGQRLVNGPETCPDAVVMHRRFLGINTPVPYERPGLPPGMGVISCKPEEVGADGYCPIPRR